MYTSKTCTHLPSLSSLAGYLLPHFLQATYLRKTRKITTNPRPFACAVDSHTQLTFLSWSPWSSKSISVLVGDIFLQYVLEEIWRCINSIRYLHFYVILKVFIVLYCFYLWLEEKYMVYCRDQYILFTGWRNTGWLLLFC